MSGEIIVVRGSPKTLEANGASIANNALAQADDNTYSVTSDGLGFPDAEFVLTGTFGTAPTEGTVLSLYAQPLDVDGTADAQAPETTRPTRWIGNFVVNNVTTAQTMVLSGVGYAEDVPELASYFVHNNGTGQTLSSGWVLKVTPRTVKTAP